MTEHEKLKAICEKIGYKIEIELEWDCSIYDEEIDYEHDVVVTEDVRRVIFTQEFMDLFMKFMYRKGNLDDFSSKCFTRAGIAGTLCMNLDNPVDYIYNLLFQYGK